MNNINEHKQNVTTLVTLAKKTNNMPTLMYATEQLRKLRIKTFKLYQGELNTLYDAVTLHDSLKGEKLENNFIKIMDNWKEYKKLYVTS